MVESILIGVFSSLAASFLFISCLFRFRPKINISPWIACKVEDDGKRYYFKVVNRTRRDLIDIRVRLHLRTPMNAPGGTIWYQRTLRLTREERFLLSKYAGDDRDAKYAVRFQCNEDLDAVWEVDGAHLVFLCHAKDSFTGFSRIETCSYHSKEADIKHGSHRFGDSLEVV